MLGDFFTRVSVLVFGYAYPAFECYKTLEKNKVNIEELRFWCQYWIIAASITVFERFGDIFVSWIPMYGEAKLALFIYLWYPKTKGCGFVYESIVRPYISKHETDIDRSIKELRARGMDLVIYYWQNFSKSGKDKFFEILQYFASQTANMANPKTELQASATSSPPPPSSPPSTPISPISQVKKSIMMLSENNRQKYKRQLSGKKVGLPPMAPQSPTASPTATTTATALHVVARSASARTFPIQAEKATTSFPEDKGQILNDMVDQNGVDHDVQSPTLKLLRRSKTSPLRQ